MKTNSPAIIRIIIDKEHDPAFNMAADSYLLQKCSTENKIFIRFYSWAKPSISLGYMQKAAEILDSEKMKHDCVLWVKRPTGGRAILHYEDLTYSCVFPKSLRCMGSTVQQTYSIITGCLTEGFVQAGLNCEAHDSYDQLLEVKREIKLPCFLSPNRDEIMVNGKKLAGSAQRRTTRGVLQHGSIPITDFYRRLPMYIRISEKEQIVQMRLLKAKSCCIQEIKPDLDSITLVEHLKYGFIKKISLPFVEQCWSNEELLTIEKATK